MNRYFFAIGFLVSFVASIHAQNSNQSPGTVSAIIEWIQILEDASLCGVNKPKAANIKIIQIKRLGSGLVSRPSQGDTLLVELRMLSDAVPGLSEEGLYQLTENPCLTADQSYYSVFYKPSVDN